MASTTPRPPLSTNSRALGSALIAAVCATIATSHATAADLGGTCCADLEERVAELEATTVRKGNRKVSLTVSGYLAQEITVWDDGGETNTYIHGLGPTQTSHIKFNGKAQIVPGWTAGYMLRIQDLTGNPFSAPGTAMDQNNPTNGADLNTQMSFWYIDSKDLGKVSVGKQAHAAKSAAMFTDQSGTQIIDNYTFLDGFPAFIIRSAGNLAPSALTWGSLAYCYGQARPLGGDCNGIVMNGVRYDTPAFKGFTASASWGEDDFWEVALRYAGEVSGFKLALGLGYSEFTNEPTPTAASRIIGKSSNFVQAGGYAQHIATGLFAHVAYGREDNSDTQVLLTTPNAIVTPPDSHHWYVKAGIRQKWTALGATIVYGDYAEYYDQLSPAALNLGVTGSTLEVFGGGIAQEIDAASMTLYAKYKHYEADVTGGAINGVTGLDDADFYTIGGLINF